MEANLKSLEQMSTEVSAEAAAAEAALNERIKAEAQLLERVVKLVKPALKAVSSRPFIESVTWWPTSATTETECVRATVRGLRVEGCGPTEDHPQATSGTYDGIALWLLDDGSFVEITYSGHWSRWQGAKSKWNAEISKPLSLEAVARGWDAPTIIGNLAHTLQKSLRTREKTRASNIQRTAKVKALSALLGD